MQQKINIILYQHLTDRKRNLIYSSEEECRFYVYIHIYI